MKEIPDLKINTAEYDLPNGAKGKIAVFIYSGNGNPTAWLDLAVGKYVEDAGHYELIDAKLENPWMRVVLSDINDMEQEIFNPEKHKLKTADGK
jgi:hypothetical protein